MRTHKQLKELLGAYAVDAVDSDERRDIDSHLLTCDSCLEEVSGHLEALSLLSEEEQPPAAVWDRIAGSLQGTPPQPRLISHTASVQRSRWMPSRLGFALGAAAMILFAVMGARMIEQERKMNELEVTLASDEIQRAAQHAAQDPDAQLLTIASSDKAKIVRLVLLPDGQGFVLSENLGELTTDQTYQLWALRGEDKISLGVLGHDPGPTAFRSVGGASGYAITIERRGGVPQPQNSPIVFGFIEEV